MMDRGNLIIAIDGHSSTGKSSFARAIAQRYSLNYIDSGALYRGVTLLIVREGIGVDKIEQESERVEQLLRGANFIFLTTGEEGERELYLNGERIEGEIRSLEISQLVSKVAKLTLIRDFVNSLLRGYSKGGGVVMDGRDIGTVVLPNANLKIFMTASPEIRAERRYRELIESGSRADYTQILNNLIERDYLDQNRESAPLRRAAEAILLDNSSMSKKEQMEWLERIVEERWGSK